MRKAVSGRVRFYVSSFAAVPGSDVQLEVPPLLLADHTCPLYRWTMGCGGSDEVECGLHPRRGVLSMLGPRRQSRHLLHASLQQGPVSHRLRGSLVETLPHECEHIWGAFQNVSVKDSRSNAMPCDCGRLLPSSDDFGLYTVPGKAISAH